MRIIRNRPDQLVLAHRPIWLAVIIAGFAAIFLIATLTQLSQNNPAGLVYLLPVAFCGLMFFILIRPVRVIFDAPSQSVEIIRTTLLGRSRVTHSLAEVTRAKMWKWKTLNNPTQTQVFLLLSGESAGPHPITPRSSHPSHAYLIKTINRWLDSARRAA